MDYLNISETFPSLAQKRTRVFAAIVDYIIYFICFWIIAITYGEKHFTADGYSYVVENGYAKLAILIFWVVLFPVLEGQKGQTIGKRIFKIKVLKIDYSEAGLSHSIVRHLFDLIDGFLFGLVGLLVGSNTKLKQRIGDLVAKTIVVDIS